MDYSRRVERMGCSRRVEQTCRAAAAAPRTSGHPHARLRSPRRLPSPSRPTPARAPPPPPTPTPAPRTPRRMPRGGSREAYHRTHSRRRHAVRRLGQSWGVPVGRGGRRGEHLHAASGRVRAYLEGVGSGKLGQRGRCMRGAVVRLEHCPHAYLWGGYCVVVSTCMQPRALSTCVPSDAPPTPPSPLAAPPPPPPSHAVRGPHSTPKPPAGAPASRASTA